MNVYRKCIIVGARDEMKDERIRGEAVTYGVLLLVLLLAPSNVIGPASSKRPSRR